jgi:hypothetical protein
MCLPLSSSIYLVFIGKEKKENGEGFDGHG